jgi:hypothetical protein
LNGENKTQDDLKVVQQRTVVKQDSSETGLIEGAAGGEDALLASSPSSQKYEADTAKEELQSMCPEHNKPIEGYCENERQTLCIGCILSGDHKNHEITSITKAANQEKDSLTLKFKQSKTLQDLLEVNLNKIQSHQESLKNQA